jgi:uncharacterized protein with ATP-grasp and redox domains
MRIYLDCIPCFLRQALGAARLVSGDEHIHEQVVREVLRLMIDLDVSQSPPAIGQQIHRLIRRLVKDGDPYHEIKARFNNVALGLYPGLKNRVTTSEDPLATAVRLAIAGNIIDFGVDNTLGESHLNETIDGSLSGYVDPEQVESLREAATAAERILYLADNAGEIVFDRLLIEQLPAEKITVAVKGGPVINDATMEDAEVAGLVGMVEVIDNGSDAPGTILHDCSPAFRDRFSKADLVIAKGQGNYETLSEAGGGVFFILKVKCSVIARDIGCEVGELVVRRSTKSGSH